MLPTPENVLATRPDSMWLAAKDRVAAWLYARSVRLASPQLKAALGLSFLDNLDTELARRKAQP